MSSLTCGELCRLFCCPPCPGRIAAKLAFIPPDPTYSVIPTENPHKYMLHLTDRAEWQYSDREQQNLEVSGTILNCFNVKCINDKL